MTYKEKATTWYARGNKETDEFLKFILYFISTEAILDGQSIRSLKLRQDLLKEINPEDIDQLKKELDTDPHKNMDTHGDHRWGGTLQNNSDFDSIIEFLARGRNNLFHGDKGADVERDIFIITYGNKILQPIIRKLISENNV